MSKRKPFSLVSRFLLGTFAASGTAVAAPSSIANVETDWSAVRRDLQNAADQSEGMRLLALETAAQLNAGAPLKDTIIASYMSSSEAEYSKLDVFWLNHDRVQANTQATEQFLEIRAGLTAQRAILSGPNSGSWKHLAVGKVIDPYDGK